MTHLIHTPGDYTGCAYLRSREFGRHFRILPTTHISDGKELGKVNDLKVALCELRLKRRWWWRDTFELKINKSMDVVD